MPEKFLSEIKLIVGLGNPGSEYEQTRHNAGAALLGYINKQTGLADFQFDKYANALISRTSEIGNQKSDTLVLAFPQTFMNESGKSVKFLMEKENLQPNQMLVLHDDKDFNFEDLKLQKEISSAGHKGVQSIIDAIGTNNFWRLRIGIGPVPEPMTTDVFVLQNFTTEEINKLESIFKKATMLIFN